VEVNTMEASSEQFQVVVDRGRLQSRSLSLADVVSALRPANLNVGGGYGRSTGGIVLCPRSGDAGGRPDEIGSVVVRTSQGGTPVLVRDVADVKVGAPCATASSRTKANKRR